MRQVSAPGFFVFQVLAISVLIGFILVFPDHWTAARITGAALIVVAAALLLTARYQLGKSFAVTAQARELVTHGLYSRIRNPIYVFGALLFAGVCLYFQKPCLFLVLLIVVPIQIWRAHKEARVLEMKFGDVYRQYRKHTWF